MLLISVVSIQAYPRYKKKKNISKNMALKTLNVVAQGKTEKEPVGYQFNLYNVNLNENKKELIENIIKEVRNKNNDNCSECNKDCCWCRSSKYLEIRKVIDEKTRIEIGEVLCGLIKQSVKDEFLNNDDYDALYYKMSALKKALR